MYARGRGGVRAIQCRRRILEGRRRHSSFIRVADMRLHHQQENQICRQYFLEASLLQLCLVKARPSPLVRDSNQRNY